MPYREGPRLPGERASRMGHLEVLKSDLVRQLCERFEDNTVDEPTTMSVWEPLPTGENPLPIVFGVDGSLQVVTSEAPPQMALAFVKTALLAVDQHALSRLDKDAPHPFALRDILSKSAQFHATVFPLRHVGVPGMRNYDAIRQIVYESFKDPPLEVEPFETLKWLIYEKWSERGRDLVPFQCPHCEQQAARLPYDADEGVCSNPDCRGKLFVTDFLGFHQEMAPDSLATSYMMVHETLLLFTAVRYFWQNQRQVLATCLFVKDGPLSIYSQYAKLVDAIRRFLAFAKEEGWPIYMLGQEKTGRFVDHLQLIGRHAPSGSIFIPDSTYITEQIQHRFARGKTYGEETNFATLPTILSNRYEGALLPIELAHSVASLSTYPSAPILKMFAERAWDGPKGPE